MIEYVALHGDLGDRLRRVDRRIFTDTFAGRYEQEPFEAFCDAVYGPDGAMARDLRWRTD